MKKGFTLIETIVAVGVLSIGVLGLSTFFAQSSTLSHVASSKSIAANLAQGLIDEQNGLSYDELPVGQSIKERVSTDPAGSFYNYYKQSDISLIDSNLEQTQTDIGMKKIEIIISYQERGQEKNVTLATIKSK